MGVGAIGSGYYGQDYGVKNAPKETTQAFLPSEKNRNEVKEVEKSAADIFKERMETILEEHRLTCENIKKEDDWRKMEDEEWDKLMEHIDKYVDAYKAELEHMKELREEAAMKAMADAPADMRATAASKAMLRAGAGGIVWAEAGEDVDHLEKISWTYDLQTDDQTILATAKMANEYAADMLSKSQEMALTGDTSVGISEGENLKESASVKVDEDKKKIWTITAYTEQGIICNQCVDGVTKELWRLEYQNPGDAKKVWDFLAGFDKNADFSFAGERSFWENFLYKRK